MPTSALLDDIHPTSRLPAPAAAGDGPAPRPAHHRPPPSAQAQGWREVGRGWRLRGDNRPAGVERAVRL